MVFASDWGTGQVFLEMLYFFLFIIWLWLLIIVFGDIFRSSDLSGLSKTLWVIFVIILPYLGVFVYLIARGHKMQAHAAEQATRQNAMMQQYIQDVTSSGKSSADEIASLADLRAKGVLSEEEFQAAKAKALAS
jgi:ABC-type multidrug transport system fused ATPase/permease subunit